MKIGFLSIERQTVDTRLAKILLFDSGHSADLFVTAEVNEIDAAINMLRLSCDAIVVDGNVNAFYDMYKDTLSTRPDHFELDGKLHSVTASVTREWLEQKFIPLVNKKQKKRYAVMFFKTYGKSVDELKTILKEYMNKKSKVQFGFFPDFLECEVHARIVTSMPKEDMNEISARLVDLLDSVTYAYEDVSVMEVVARQLRSEGLKIKIAESFTGGAIGAAFTSLPGASDYLVEDVVTYSVASKHKRLGVPYELIAEKGVVSGDTAYNMALGLMTSGDCDIAIATTGNAGPTAQGGELGLCYIALGITSQKSIAVFKYLFGGDREYNIKCGVKNAVFLLYKSLIGYKVQKKQRQVASEPVKPPVPPVPPTPTETTEIETPKSGYGFTTALPFAPVIETDDDDIE